ncbi:hypothetical protein [Pseudoroseicyclus tamaricis]|uniref:Uncharacterized protein n=1 Tax=Pseudoroseicyclus tamaricis TaxID=2705421 RepID=A0A6B2JUD5_9RHOB|nr:hypothetical protein [Pseudoroseicyclus tamaricis]NDV02147.1 hypothetical protein [Pseudoroseicyclus tamaricis]
MTALSQYQRLESSGLWRAEASAQRREVFVSFGDATLVISDPNGRPLAHWSLPAIERQNPDTTPAIYAPGPETGESLEIDEALMIDAIETVRGALARSRPKRGRLRYLGLGTFLAVLLGVVVFWLPGALQRQTLAVVPMAKRLEIGASLLGHVQRQAGSSCRDPLGTQALATLQQRLFGDEGTGQLVVLPQGPDWGIILPGRIVLLSEAMVEEPEEAAVPAGHALTAWISRAEDDPMEALLADAGLGATLTLLTTGDLPDDAIAAHAAHLLQEPPEPASRAELAAGFEAEGMSFAAWSARVDPEGTRFGESTGPVPQALTRVPLLTDADWIALKGICQG